MDVRFATIKPPRRDARAVILTRLRTQRILSHFVLLPKFPAERDVLQERTNIKVAAKSIFKVFGNTPDAALRLLRDGQGKDEIFETTGNKAAFDRDGDGKADMVACPPGWGCEIMIEHHMDAYDLRDHVNTIKAGYSASMADAIAAHGAGEPILFYTWTPNWTVNELAPGEDVVWIEVPEVNLPDDMADLADAATREGVAGCVADPCTLGFPANDIVPVANTAFLDGNPAVRALLEEASVPLDAIFAQNARMNDGDDDVEAHAAEWIEENRETVDGWLETARSAS